MLSAPQVWEASTPRRHSRCSDLDLGCSHCKSAKSKAVHRSTCTIVIWGLLGLHTVAAWHCTSLLDSCRCGLATSFNQGMSLLNFPIAQSAYQAFLSRPDVKYKASTKCDAAAGSRSASSRSSAGSSAAPRSTSPGYRAATTAAPGSASSPSPSKASLSRSPGMPEQRWLAYDATGMGSYDCVIRMSNTGCCGIIAAQHRTQTAMQNHHVYAQWSPSPSFGTWSPQQWTPSPSWNAGVSHI